MVSKIVIEQSPIGHLGVYASVLSTMFVLRTVGNVSPILKSKDYLFPIKSDRDHLVLPILNKNHYITKY